MYEVCKGDLRGYNYSIRATSVEVLVIVLVLQ